MKSLIKVALMIFAMMTMQSIQAKSVDEELIIDGFKGRLAARLQLPELSQSGKIPMVILCHGFTGNMDFSLFDSISVSLVEEGIGVLRFDFNGHGKSEGSFTDMTQRNRRRKESGSMGQATAIHRECFAFGTLTGRSGCRYDSRTDGHPLHQVARAYGTRRRTAG